MTVKNHECVTFACNACDRTAALFDENGGEP